MISRLAKQQHGIVSVGQLRAAGVSEDAVRGRVRAGRLHRIHRGVYAVGHMALCDEARWMAAVIACRRGGTTPDVGTPSVNDAARAPAAAIETDKTNTVLGYWGAALSHRSAAQLWGLLPTKEGAIDVSIPGYGGKKRRREVRLHRSLSLLPAHVTLRSGIPVTKAARTIADLRRVVLRQGQRGLISPRELRRAIRQAEVLGLPIDNGMARDRTRSDLEGDFLRLCRRHKLPAPEVNIRVGPHLVDFLWRDVSVIVETDGYKYHRGRTAFVDDRARDLELRRRGFEVVRLSEEQVNGAAEQVAGALRRLVQRHTR